MKQNDVDRFQRHLAQWYDTHKRYMPWRITRNPYHIWISEVMLQQTQVATVIDYFNRFIEAFPTIDTLARAPLELVLKHWEGLGYYSRARNLHHAVNQLVENGCHDVPDAPETFRQLRGVGDYINAAVQSIAFHHPLAVVDGNVKRVIARLHLMDTPVNQSSAHKIYAAEADKLLDRNAPSTFNQAMMELGALVCKPRIPKCANCPVQSFCNAYERSLTHEYPKRLLSKKVPIRQMAAALVRDEDRFLILRRPAEGFLGGMWELPTTEIVSGETTETRLLTAIETHTSIEAEKICHITDIKHAYTHFKLRLSLFLVDTTGPSPPHLPHPEKRWIRLENIEEYPFHKAVHKCFPAIKKMIDQRIRCDQGAITYRPGAA